MSSAILRIVKGDDREVAEGLFKVFCAAAENVDSAFLPEPFYRESQLHAMLSAHAPLRDLWLKHVIARFPERPQVVMVLRLLDDFQRLLEPPSLPSLAVGKAFSVAYLIL